MAEGAIKINSAKSRASVWIFILLIAFLIVLVGDGFFFERNSPLERNFPDDGTARNFNGNLVLSNLTYDRQTKSTVARVGLEISATQPDLEIQRVAFSYQENSDGSKDWTICHQGDSCLSAYKDVQGTTGKLVTSARIQLDSIHLQGKEDWSEILYPFDKSTYELSLLGCVNDSVEDCTNGHLSFRTLRIELADPDFVLEGGGADLSAKSTFFSLKRKFFLRLVSVIFFVIAIVFFVHLFRLSAPDELMTQSLGFFGTLWGLRAVLVPGTIKVFPTLVDYVVLGAFCLLFALVVARVQFAPVKGS